MLADRIQRIGFSPTLKITAKAKAMQAEGIDVVDFSVGEPDFPTPENVKAAGKSAIDENFTKYTENDGIPELKAAIINKLKQENGLEYDPSEIIVSSGAKNCIYNLSVALFNRDEECVIPAPYWVSYPHMVSLAKGKPVIIHDRQAHTHTLEILRQWVTESRPELAEHRGVLHCFSGDLILAQQALELGFLIGVDGPVTYQNARKLPEVVKALPLDRLLVETDAPFLTPHPYRGRRNEPAYVRLVAEKVADLKDLPPEEVAQATTANAQALFRFDIDSP